MTYYGTIDHEALRQELVKVLPDNNWYLTGATGEVTFNSADLVNEELAQPVIEQHIADATKRETNNIILVQIAELEATATPRRIRESLVDPTWMKALDDQIAELRGQLQ